MEETQYRETAIIADYMIKGGVGKSTTTYNFAALAAETGKKVLCIDMDPQGNLCKLLNGAKEIVPENGERYVKGAYEILVERVPADELIRRTSFEQLGDNQIDYIPSGTRFRDNDVSEILSIEEGKEKLLHEIIWGNKLYESEEERFDFQQRLQASDIVSEKTKKNAGSINTESTDSKTVLKDWIKQLRGRYDYILIDVNPTRNVIAMNVLIASDYVVAPTQLDGFSEDAITDLFRIINEIRGKYNQNLGFAGMLLTAITPATKLAHAECDRFWKLVPDPENNILARAIRNDTIVRECNTIGLPLSFYKRKSRACMDYIYAAASLDLITEDEMNDLLEKHGIKNDKYDFIINPEIREKIRKEKQQLKSERQKKTKNIFGNYEG